MLSSMDDDSCSHHVQGIPDRYTGILTQRQISVYEGALLQVVSMGNLLMYSTQRGGIHALVRIRSVCDVSVLGGRACTLLYRADGPNFRMKGR